MLKVSIQNSIMTIKLNRPEKRNALNPEIVNQLIDAIQKAGNDDKVKVVILTGEGSSFCAGADLSYLNKIKDYSIRENEKDSKLIGNLFLKIYNFPKPIIAAVNGPAIAGGCGLASVCDIIIADEVNAKFGYSEVKIGFLPAIVSVFLINRIGEAKARRLLITGEILNAQIALEIGLIDQAVPDCLDTANKIAEKLLENSDESISMTKALLKNISKLNVREAVNYCVGLNAVSRSSKDFSERLNQFLNKK
jgi:methylglutaconyl-CoA hydratase